MNAHQIRSLLFIHIFILIFSLRANEQSLVEINSDFFEAKEEIELTLDIDNAGNILTLNKVNLINDKIIDTQKYTPAQIKAKGGVTLFESEGREVIKLLTKNSQIEMQGGQVIIDYLFKGALLQSFDERKQVVYTLVKRSDKWVLTDSKGIDIENLFFKVKLEPVLKTPQGIDQIYVNKN